MKAEAGLGWKHGRLSEIQGVAKSKSSGLKLVLVFKCASLPWCARVCVCEETDSISTSGRVRLVTFGMYVACRDKL